MPLYILQESPHTLNGEIKSNKPVHTPTHAFTHSNSHAHTHNVQRDSPKLIPPHNNNV